MLLPAESSHLASLTAYRDYYSPASLRGRAAHSDAHHLEADDNAGDDSVDETGAQRQRDAGAPNGAAAGPGAAVAAAADRCVQPSAAKQLKKAATPLAGHQHRRHLAAVDVVARRLRQR